MIGVSPQIERFLAVTPDTGFASAQRTEIGLRDVLEMEVPHVADIADRRHDPLRKTYPGPHQPFEHGVLAFRLMHDLKRLNPDVPRAGKEIVPHDRSVPILRGLRSVLSGANIILESEGAGSDLNDVSLVRRLVQRQEEFFRDATDREIEIAELCGWFALRAHDAVDVQGLPLTHEQIDDRLSGVEIGFSDLLNQRLADGDYMPLTRRVRISSGAKNVRRVGFHELWHALSGRSVDKFGRVFAVMRPRGRAGRSRNEATTDLGATIFLDETAGHTYQFDDSGSALWNPSPRESIARLASRSFLEYSQTNYYGAEKEAWVNLTQRVPAKVLMDAYFKQNNDPFEEDKRAGTHAIRELYRSMFRAGGAQRLLEVRAIDELFGNAHMMERKDPGMASAFRNEAMAMALELVQEDILPDGEDDEMAEIRATHQAELDQRQWARRKQIEAAKQLLVSRG